MFLAVNAWQYEVRRGCTDSKSWVKLPFALELQLIRSFGPGGLRAVLCEDNRVCKDNKEQCKIPSPVAHAFVTSARMVIKRCSLRKQFGGVRRLVVSKLRYPILHFFVFRISKMSMNLVHGGLGFQSSLKRI